MPAKGATNMKRSETARAAKTEELKVEFRGAACRITINRPDTRNSLNQYVADGIREAIAAAAKRPGCRAIILTGAGDKVFCSGADLAKNARGSAFAVKSSKRHYMAALLQAMHESPLPLIARVNGHALAGGLGLVCSCDLIVCVEGAQLGLPEAKVGIAPVMILPPLLRAIPRALLREMILTGEPITAKDALAHGIVNYATPANQLDQRVDWLLERIAAASPTGLRFGKQALATMDRLSVKDSLAYAQRVLPMMASTPDADEGRRAFQEKRIPAWSSAFKTTR
jgi:enoyl-CoA hydratase/carnithine racemase